MKRQLKSFILLTFALHLSTMVQPALAQFIGNDSRESKVVQISSVPKSEDSQRTHAIPTKDNSVSPLSGGTDGAIAPQNDATVVAGVNTAGTVRVNNLAMLEALANLGANGIVIVCMIWGAVLVYIGSTKIGLPQMVRYFTMALFPVACGLLTPTSVNWAFALCREYNLFG